MCQLDSIIRGLALAYKKIGLSYMYLNKLYSSQIIILKIFHLVFTILVLSLNSVKWYCVNSHDIYSIEGTFYKFGEFIQQKILPLHYG